MLAAGARDGVGCPAVHAGRIDGLPNFGQYPVGHEAAPRHRVEVEGFLIDLDLLLETNLGDRHEWLAPVAGALGFDADGCVSGDGAGQRLFTDAAVLR